MEKNWLVEIQIESLQSSIRLFLQIQHHFPFLLLQKRMAKLQAKVTDTNHGSVTKPWALAYQNFPLWYVLRHLGRVQILKKKQAKKEQLMWHLYSPLLEFRPYAFSRWSRLLSYESKLSRLKCYQCCMYFVLMNVNVVVCVSNIALSPKSELLRQHPRSSIFTFETVTLNTFFF